MFVGNTLKINEIEAGKGPFLNIPQESYFTVFYCRQIGRELCTCHLGSVTRLGDLLDFGQLFIAFGNN